MFGSNVLSDGGKEFDNIDFQKYFLKTGIYFQKSCPGTPEQNGVVERKHRHLVEMAQTLLLHASLPGEF